MAGWRFSRPALGHHRAGAAGRDPRQAHLSARSPDAGRLLHLCDSDEAAPSWNGFWRAIRWWCRRPTAPGSPRAGVRFERIRAEIEQVLQTTGSRPARRRGCARARKLRPNQARAVEVARRLGRLLIADDVGLGKTLGALATVMDDRFLPAAIIVRDHVATQWQRDFIGKFTTLSSHVVQSTQFYVLPNVDCYIFKYSNAFGWVDIAATGRFRSVIFDEVQNLRHGIGTQKGAAAKCSPTTPRCGSASRRRRVRLRRRDVQHLRHHRARHSRHPRRIRPASGASDRRRTQDDRQGSRRRSAPTCAISTSSCARSARAAAEPHHRRRAL
jgi:hypothetical protein